MKKFILICIKFYQILPVPSLHQACRFSPTCSEYTYQAIQKYGIVRGSFIGIKRIFRCHPGSKPGFDPLP